jgi:lipopolysaccharide export system permease protein
MKLIERYIFRRVFILSVGTLATTTTIALTTQVLLRVNLLSSTGQSLLTFLELAGLLIPSMLIIVVPFALMIGAAQTLATMNSDSEMVVVEASGGSRLLTARPILLIATLMSLATLLTGLYAEPWANRHLRNLLDRASADLFSVAVQSGTFHKIEDDLYVNIAEKLPGGKLGGIFLSDQRDKKTDLIYYAKYGAFAESEGKDILILSDGELHRKDTGSGAISVIRFATYGLDLSLIGGRSGKPGRYYPKSQPTSFLLNPDVNDSIYQAAPELFTREIHKRFSLWLYPLLFGLITVYFLGKAHTNRHEQVWSVVTAAGVAFALRGFSFYAVDQSGHSRIFEIITYAIPVGGITLFTFVMLTNWSFRVPQYLIDQSASLMSGTESLPAMFRTWISGLGPTGKRGAQ